MSELLEELVAEAYPTAEELQAERYGQVCAIPACPLWTRNGLYCRSHRCRRCDNRAERGRLGYCRTHYTQAHEAGEQRDDLPAPKLPIDVDTRWMSQAACSGASLEIFFPEGNAGAGRYVRQRQYAEAIALCDRCPVRPQCLEFALATDPTIPVGMFGGATPSQRIDLRAKSRARRR